jgi:hypothetical protein
MGARVALTGCVVGDGTGVAVAAGVFVDVGGIGEEVAATVGVAVEGMGDGIGVWLGVDVDVFVGNTVSVAVGVGSAVLVPITGCDTCSANA